MPKTRQEKITSYEERIAQLENQRKQEIQKLKKEERKARTKRLCSRHGLLESMLPEIISITDEQYKAFLEKAVTNDYGRGILAKITAQGAKNDTSKAPTGAVQAADTPTAKTTTAAAQSAPTPNAKPTQTAHRNPTAESAKADGGATVEG